MVVMELMPLGDLRRFLQQRPMPVAAQAAVARRILPAALFLAQLAQVPWQLEVCGQIASALSHVHAHGIVHRVSDVGSARRAASA